jgi:hypothetical protein
VDLPEQSSEIIYIEEPELGFGHGQTCDYPKDGLYLYGPHSAPDRQVTINVGVVATPKGLEYFGSKLDEINGFVPVPPPGPRDKEYRLHLSHFPGLTEAFGIRVDADALVRRSIDEGLIDEATRNLSHHEAVRKAVDLYVSEIEHHESNEELEVDVWFLVLPELVFERCRPQSKRSGLPLVKGDFGKRQKKPADLPLLSPVLDMSGEEIFEDIPDFHRQAKARLLKTGKTSQVIRETTLAPDQHLNKAGYPLRRLQDPATLAWNLATGLYYKTRPDPPWKLVTARDGVCYMGIVFKLLPNHPQQHACCAAQMFLNEGDGLVFRGANGPYQTRKNEFHLTPEAAKDLINKVVTTFRDKHEAPPKELFIHGRTKFNDEEWDAFCAACPDETNLVYVRIRTTTGDTKLYRHGDYPVIRGTALMLDKQNAYFWSNGFLPRLDTYIGPETPNPLFISLLRSSGDMPELKDVLRDILGLTKINYNACNFNDGLPVTVRFADRVGDVLVMGSAQGHERQPFKFYI